MQKMVPGARQLDSFDQKIIALLRDNARRSATALARFVGLSRTAVQERIARLEREGIILGYPARIAESVVEGGAEAIISLKIKTRPCAAVIERFRSWPEIRACYSVAGAVDAVLVVRVENPAMLSQLVDRLSAIHGVGAVESAVILSQAKTLL